METTSKTNTTTVVSSPLAVVDLAGTSQPSSTAPPTLPTLAVGMGVQAQLGEVVLGKELNNSFSSGSQVSPSPAVLKPKITKEEKEALRMAREKERAEVKAKKEAEQLRKEKEKAELKAKREAENLKKEQEKREKQQKKEQEMKERQEKKEREDLEKKEKREKREAEKKKRDDEKRLKEESRKKKLEEKEQQKEVKLRKEEQAKMKFRSFFTKIENPVKKEFEVFHSILTPFSVKEGMLLAMPSRCPIEDTSILDELLQHQDKSVDYLKICKLQSARKPTHVWARAAVEPMEVDDNDDDDGSCQVWEEEKVSVQQRKFKLLQFRENHRPAYYGTWSKPRGKVNPRNPFRMDSELLDYSVDSDEEWEEDDPGESLSDSEGEENEVVDEEDEEDDGFLVPHGYLSNDEGDHSDGEEEMGFPEDQEDRKNTQLAQAKAWEAEFARKCQPLTVKVVGPTWPRSGPAEAASGDSAPSPPSTTLSCDEAFLSQFAAVSLVPLPIPNPMATRGEASSGALSDGISVPGSGNTAESMKQPVPEGAMPDLIRFLHKNSMGVTKIVRLFRAHWGAKICGRNDDRDSATEEHQYHKDSMDVPMATNGLTPHKTNHGQSVMATTPRRTKTLGDTGGGAWEFASGISKRQLERKIQAIAVKETRPPTYKAQFYVHPEVMQDYELNEENMVALVSDGTSPMLVGTDILKPSSLVSPDAQGKTKKVPLPSRSNQSLLHFLKNSPKSSSTGACGSKADGVGGSPAVLGKHPAAAATTVAKENQQDDAAFIMKVKSPGSDENLKEPAAKKLHLDSFKPEPLSTKCQQQTLNT